MSETTVNKRLSFSETLHDPYYIYAPDYRQSSAGIRALHYLCHFLNENGYEAYVTANVTNPDLRTPLLTGKVVQQHFRSGRIPIGVYPEVAGGNPLKLFPVVRWLLNKPGHLGGDTHYAPSDLIFYFDSWVLPEGITGQHLRVPTLDSKIFNNLNNEFDKHRHGFCYYANKFLAAGGSIPEELKRHGISLGQEQTLTHEEIANHLRRSEALICFEQSAIIGEARACGCPVLIVPSDYWEKTRWEVFSTGTALSTEQDVLPRLRQELADIERERQEQFDYCKELVEQFIDHTQKTSRSLERKTPTEIRPESSDIWLLSPSERHRHQPAFERIYRQLFADIDTTQADFEAVYNPAKSIARNTTPPLALPRQQASIHIIVVREHESEGSLKSTLDSLNTSIDDNHCPKVTILSVAPPDPDSMLTGVAWTDPGDDIGLAINQLLDASPNAWVGIIRAGDRFAPDAMPMIQAFLSQTQRCSALLSDFGTTNSHGEYLPPKIFGALDIELLRAGRYVGAFLLAASAIWRKAGGWRTLPRGLDEHDASLRIYDACGQQEFRHCPGVLLHRSANTFPAAFLQQAQVVQLSKQVIQEHLARSGYSATVQAGTRPHQYVIRPNLAATPKVSIVVLTKDNREGLKTCVRSVLENTDYPNLEILIVDNGTTEPAARELLDDLAAIAQDSIRIIVCDAPFNFGEMCNKGAHIAAGELLLFLHDDIEALHPDWLSRLVALCWRTGTAMTGARLISRDAKIKEAGIVPMMYGITGNPFNGASVDDAEAHDLLHSTREVSAISAACMLVRRDVYLQLEGMDAVNFPSRAADIDFCLKLRAAGHKIVWTPDATLLHDSDGTMAGNRNDNNALLAKWGNVLIEDPSISPYSALDSATFAPEHDPTFQPDPINWVSLPNVYGALLGHSSTCHHRVGSTVQAATAMHHVRGRVGSFLPLPVQLKRLGIDVVHLAAPITEHQIRELEAYRRLLNCRIVMDLDSLLDQESGTASIENIQLELQSYDRVVDLFTTSRQALADLVADQSRRTLIIPDALNTALWEGRTSFRREGEKIRIGWHGMAADLEVIAPVVMSLAAMVDWVFIGDFPSVLAPCAKECHKDISFGEYPAKLASLSLDLAICPLPISEHNRWRTDLPLLEYGALGIPVIATDSEPFRTGLPVTLTDNTVRGWTEAIRFHAQERAASRQRGEALRTHVLAHRTLAQTMPLWQEAWKCERNATQAATPASHNAASSRKGQNTSNDAAGFESAYQQWLSARYENTRDAGPALMYEKSVETISFHIILRQPENDTSLLAETLDSLGQQLHQNWHLDIVTPLPPPQGIEEIGAVCWRCLNDEDEKSVIDSLIQYRESDLIVELPSGAVLDPLCLWRLARESRMQLEVSAFFVDDDIYDAAGRRQQPRFKPGINQEWLQCMDLAGPLFVRRATWISCGGASAGNGSPWFDMLIRIAGQSGWKSLGHVADVLISYPEQFPTDVKSCLTSLVGKLHAESVGAEILPAAGRSWRLRYPLGKAPAVSVAILSQGQVDMLSRCLDCLIERTRYPDFEILISLTDKGLDPELDDWLANTRQRSDFRIRAVSTAASGSHASRCNAAIDAATNELVLLLREEAIVVQAGWLDELVRTICQPGIAAVSPCLISPGDKRIENAGHVLGLNSMLGSPYQGQAGFDELGYLGYLQVCRDASVLPAACMLIRKEAYQATGGMDEIDLGERLSEADLCRKLSANGQRLLYQPLATVLYRGSSELAITGDAEGQARRLQETSHAERTFAARWLKPGTGDPYWNPNLSLTQPVPTPETDFQAEWQFLPAEAPRIFARTLPNAQGEYRINAPLKALSRSGQAAACIWEQGSARELSISELLLLAPDTAIVQHYLMDQYLGALQEWTSIANRPFIVYSLDDMITNLDETNPARKNIPANSRTRFKYALERCDRLVVSTDFLAETYRHFIADIRVVPNRLAQSIWLPLHTRKRTGRKPRIGWAGGTTHQGDLMLLKEVIEQTRDEADWIFFGMCPDAIRPLLAEYHELAPVADYPALLASLNLDIAVAPLALTPFNRGKSNLRLLEYGALGIPVVCSDIDPYRDSPACRVQNTVSSWVAAIRERIHDADAREQEGRVLRKWVHQNYLLEDHLDDWLTAHIPN